MMFNLFSKKKKETHTETNNNATNNNTLTTSTGGIQSIELPPLNEIQILSEHTKPIKTLLKIDSERLASASDDNVILIWSISTGRLIMRLEGHSNRVTCLLSFGNILVSGSMDRRIKIWDLNKVPLFNQMSKSYYLESNKTLEIHKSSLKFLEKIPNGFCSVSNDDDLIIWNEEGEFIKNIVRIQKEYTHGILCVNSYILVAGSTAPYLIAYKYDSQQNEPAKTLGKDLTHKDCISSLFNTSSKNFVTGSKDQSIIVWDSDTLSPLHQLCCKQPINYLFPINNYILATIKKGFSILDIMNGTTILEHVPTEIEDNTTTELNGAITLYDHTKILTWADHRVSVWNWPYESILNHNNYYNLSSSIGSGMVNNSSNSINSGSSGSNKKKLPLKPTFIGDMKGHTDYINCVTILSENSIATGSSDCNIILWKDGKIQSESRTFLSNHLNDFYAKTSSQYIEHYIDDHQDYNDDTTFE